MSYVHNGGSYPTAYVLPHNRCIIIWYVRLIIILVDGMYVNGKYIYIYHRLTPRSSHSFFYVP